MSELIKVETSRFGKLCVADDQVWVFAHGLIGLAACRRWVLLGEDESSVVAWLQSLDNGELALPLVSPRRHVPDYRIRIRRGTLDSIELGEEDILFVLTTVASIGTTLTTDLRAPLLFNATRRLATQVVVQDDWPLQYVLPVQASSLRRSA